MSINFFAKYFHNKDWRPDHSPEMRLISKQGRGNIIQRVDSKTNSCNDYNCK